MYNRIRSPALYIVAIAAGLIQAGSGDYLNILSAKPDILLVVLVFFSLFAEERQAQNAALVSGVIKDMTSSAILGSYCVSYLLIALFLLRSRQRFYKEKIYVQALIVFIAGIACELLVLCFNLISRTIYVPYYSFLAISLKGAAYAALISPLIFFMLSSLFFRRRLIL